MRAGPKFETVKLASVACCEANESDHQSEFVGLARKSSLKASTTKARIREQVRTMRMRDSFIEESDEKFQMIRDRMLFRRISLSMCFFIYSNIV